MNIVAQINNVPAARPSVNSRTTGDRSGACSGATDAASTLDPIRRSTAPSPTRSPVTLRNWADSGSEVHSTGSRTSGSTPPTTKTLAQPKAGISGADSSPARTPPNGYPQNIRPTTVPRERRGVYSEVSAMALGSAPPRPIPVRNRTTTSPATEPTRGVASEQAVNTATEISSTRRRPNRSPSLPRRRAPTRLPNSPTPKTAPKAEAPTPQLSAIAGAARAMAWRSNPSSVVTTAQSSTTTRRSRLVPGSSSSSSKVNRAGYVIVGPRVLVGTAAESGRRDVGGRSEDVVGVVVALHAAEPVERGPAEDDLEIGYLGADEVEVRATGPR